MAPSKGRCAVRCRAAQAHARTLRPTALAVSRVMQVWRDIIVRNRLLEDEASSPYLQRKHLVLKDDRLPTLARQHQLSDSVPYSDQRQRQRH